MRVVRSLKRERWAFEKIKAWLTRRPRSQDAWHVSDLLYPRKAYFGRLDPKPITDKQALYFILGHGHHHVIEAILGPKKSHDRTDAGEFLKKGIYFSPDLRLPFPLEIKTTRLQKAPDDPGGWKPERAYESYLKQEGSYQALMKKSMGALLVLFLGRRKPGGWGTEPALRFYKIHMTPQERRKKIKDLVALAAKLTKAVKRRKLGDLPLCPAGFCTDCLWLKKCAPWKLDPKRKNLQKITQK